MKVTLKESQIVQQDDYYPFGLPVRSEQSVGGQHSTSWTRPLALNNKFLYNAGTELNDITKNYETPFRRYDPALGRFNGADALASGAPSLSPYRFGFNNPVSFNDPTGLNEKPYIDAERGGGGIISGGENFGSYYGWNNSVNDYWNGYRSEYGNSFMMSEQDFQQRYGKGVDEYRQDLAKLNAIRDAITELSGQMPQSDGYGGYKVTSYYTLNHSYYGNQDSYAGAFYIQPSVIRIRGLNDQNRRTDSCPDCGWNFLVGLEGEVSAGVQGGFEVGKLGAINVDVASLVLAKGRVNNLEGAKNGKNGRPRIKQGISAAYIAGISYEHSFDYASDKAIKTQNEMHQLKFGVTFIGGTFQFDSNWNLTNVFVGFDGEIGAAFLIGLKGAFKVGANYKVGN